MVDPTELETEATAEEALETEIGATEITDRSLKE